MLYKKKHNKYDQLPETKIHLERDIHQIIEKNLDTFFQLDHISTEFKIGSSRLDTLAFDKKTKSFVILEYKKRVDDGLFDQGLGYLGLLKDHKANFLVEYNAKRNRHFKINDINWEKSKIIFVSPNFNKNQTQAATLDLNIELWQIRRYDGIIDLSEIADQNDTHSIQKNKTKDTKLSQNYYEDHHHDRTPKTFALYERYRNKLNKFDNVVMNIGKKRVSMSFESNIHFVVFYFRKTKLHIQVLTTPKTSNSRKLIHSTKKMKLPNLSHGLLTITDHTDFEYILKLIKASYEESLPITQSFIANFAVESRKSEI